MLAEEKFQPGEPVSGASGWMTNHVGELTAIREARQATEGPIVIRSDSEYAIAMVMGLRKAKENRELIDEVKALSKGRNVAFEHVRAHQVDGGPLNAVADEAANAAAEGAAAAKRNGGPVLVTAKFNGLCPRCDSSYQVGTTIVKHPEGWGTTTADGDAHRANSSANGPTEALSHTSEAVAAA